MNSLKALSATNPYMNLLKMNESYGKRRTNIWNREAVVMELDKQLNVDHTSMTLGLEVTVYHSAESG
jgi:hypothetical protein